MIFGQDRGELRRMYQDAWRKSRLGEVLSPLEAQIAEVVGEHPEYHAVVEAGDESAEFLPEGGQTNPFLHMGLHLALREQVSTDRPPGIGAAWTSLVERTGDRHAAEHRMAEVLAEILWEAQVRNTLPDEALYLERLRQLAGHRR